MPDAPTPLDLDAIHAVLDRGVAATGGEWFHALRSCIDEVERLRAEVARPAPAWDEDAVVEGMARAVYPSLFTDDRQPLRGETRSDAELREGERDVARERMRQALAVVRDHLPVKPDRETVARALVTRELYGKSLAHVRIGVSWDCLLPETCERYLDQADAALDLWPGRSEAEVKAEALRDFAARVRDEMDDSDKVLGTKWATDEYRHGMRSALMQVDEEADRLAAEGGADRG